MVDTFNFECKFRDFNKVKTVDFQTSDGTEWKLSEEWLATVRIEETILQRIIFCKQNYYDRRYIVNMEITSLTSLTAGRIQITKDSGPVFSSIIIPLDQFRVFRYSAGFQYTVNGGVYIYGRVLTDRFRYKVTISRAYVLQDENDRQEIPERDKLLMFSDHIYWLLETGHFSDVVLTNGHFQIRAHRNILSARCDYFRTFFACTMIAIKDVVYISDISEETVKELLHFIYSGTVRPMRASKALELLYVADMYLVSELKMLCWKALEGKFNVDSAVDILYAAHFLLEQEQQAVCLQFVLDNFEEVQKSASWADLYTSCQTLFNEVTQQFQARGRP